MKKLISKKLCAVLMVTLMMLQTALIFPAAVSANPTEHFGVVITESPNANENQISVEVTLEVSPAGMWWMNSAFDIHYDNTRLAFVGHTVVQDQAHQDGMMTSVNHNPRLEYGDIAPPAGFAAVRIIRFHAAAQNINTPTASTILHFNILNGAPGGMAEIRWIGRDGSATIDGTNARRSIHFRNPTFEDFARVEIPGTLPSSRTVTFDLNGGAGTFPPQEVPDGERATRPTTNPTRAGYVFGGWRIAEASHNFDFELSTIRDDTTLYAHWVLDISHTVAFNLHGGTGNFPSQNIQHEARATRPATDPTRSGYTFIGWFAAETGGEAQFNFDTPITGATTIHARWAANRTVTFDLHGGTGNFPPQTVVSGGAVTEPTSNPTRAGYAFGGWWTAPTGGTGTQWRFADQIMTSFTLHARWIPTGGTNHTVTFNLHNGTGTFPGTQTVVSGGVATRPTPNPTRAGYAFGDWWTAPAGGTRVNFNASITANTTIHARWTPMLSPDDENHTVIFNLHGGQGTFTPTQAVADGDRAAQPTPSPTRTGHLFEGWWTSVTGGEQFDFDTPITETMVLHARWTAVGGTAGAVNRTVTFNLQGGTGTFPTTQTVASGERATRPTPDPTRPGHTFEGWWTAVTGGTQFNFNTSIVANITLHARWTAVGGAARTLTISNHPTITPNGQSPSAGSQTINAGTSVTLTAGSTDNWTFLGWFRAENRPAANSTVTVPASGNRQFSMPDSDVHYIAVWGNQDGVVGVVNTPAVDEGEERTAHHAFLIGFEDGTVRPTGTATRAHLATVLFRLMSDADRANYWSQTNPFADVEINNWFNNAISTTMNAGVFSPAMPMPGGRFEPERQVTRAEVIAAIVRLQGVSPVTTVMFSDISGHWAQNYINAAASEGWALGFTGIGGEFRPDEMVTRAQMAALVNRAFERLPETPADLLSDMVRWTDNANPNAWYYLYMQEATNSHYYVMKPGGVNETWTTLIPPRNWTVLERPTSRPGDIAG